MRSGRPESHMLAGAYAMDALDTAGRERFERHLARCPECAQEAGGLREATARLAAAAAVRPPAALKALVMAETARTRQLPPSTPGAAAAARRRDRAGAGAPRAGRRGPGARPRRRARPRRVALMLAGTALAGSAVLAMVTFGVTGNLSRPTEPRQEPRRHEIVAVLTAPDATVISARIKTGGSATVVMSRRERMLVFAAARLRALPRTLSYELWLMRPGLDRPAGLLPGPKHGMTGPVVASGLRTGDRLGLSVEPAHGSRHPTAPMIMVVTL